MGPYLDPPEAAVVLSVDEKSQVQALARSQPAFPMMPGMPEKRTHDYVRHGTTSCTVPPGWVDGHRLCTHGSLQKSLSCGLAGVARQALSTS